MVTIIQGTIVLAVVIANEIARRIALRSAERGERRRPPGRRWPAAGDGQTGAAPTPAPGSTDERQGAQA